MDQVFHPAWPASAACAHSRKALRPRPPLRRRRLEQARLQRALAYIDGHLDGDLGTAMLARHCGLCAPHLERAFSAAVGVSLHRYVAHKRLQRVRQWLEAGALAPFAPGAAPAATPFASQAELAAAAVRAASAALASFDEAGS